mmetsp:Transcript_407/g.533  ORF Transcript_407/g.533 Transcript_407/m.533 type:complete len:656 (+) Transcript_407:457-2424(+)
MNFHASSQRRRKFMLLIGICMIFYMIKEHQVIAIDDSDVFRVMWDTIASQVIPKVGPTGSAPKEVFLMEIPGITIRREDYDPDLWAREGFSGPSPDYLVSQLVDRVPRYDAIVFIDSHRKISRMWERILRQFVTPHKWSKSTEEELEKARVSVESRVSDLEGTVERSLFSYEKQFDREIGAVDKCLNGDVGSLNPDFCAQKGVAQSSRLRSRWFDFFTARNHLEGAQASLMSAEADNFQNYFVRQLELTSFYRRVNIGAQGFGEEYLKVNLKPSDWWTWFPLNPTQYDVTVGNEGIDPLSIKRAPYDQVKSVLLTQLFEIDNFIYEVEPVHGHVESGFGTTARLKYYVLDDLDYVGSDVFSVRQTEGPCFPDEECIAFGDPITITVGISGNLFKNTGDAFLSASQITQSSLFQSKFDSDFASFHFDDGGVPPNAASIQFQNGETIQIEDPTKRAPSAPIAEQTIALDPGNDPSFLLSFELAKVRIERPWWEPVVLRKSPVAIRGFRKHAWSDGLSYPNERTQHLFKLLPTSFIVARRIRIRSKSFGDLYNYINQLQDTFTEANMRIGPFVIGKIFSDAEVVQTKQSQQSKFSPSFIDPDEGSLVIPGPQIIGWTCAVNPAFPTASLEEIDAINDPIEQAQTKDMLKTILENNRSQ